MKKTTALFSIALLAGLAGPANGSSASTEFGKLYALTPVSAALGPVPAATDQKTPQWKSRDEYDAFQSFVKEQDASKRIPLIEAFLQKYPSSDFKSNAYVAEMQTYVQLNQSSKAIDSARQALGANPDDLDALAYLSFTFPYTFKPSDADAQTQSSKAASDAQHGLELLQKLQKPAAVPQEQFDNYVKTKRGIFNTAAGFAALQQKNYDQAIKSLGAAAEDDPKSSLIFSLLGQAYYEQQPRDVNKAIWYLARSVVLARQSNSPNTDQLQKFYSQVYEAQHGSNSGEDQVLTQAQSSATLPSDFNVAAPPKHAATGDQNLDAFYKIQDAIQVGGDTSQQNWAQLKGQPLGLVGHVDGVEPGTGQGAYLVHVDITPDSQSKPGTYDIVLQDSQPGVQYLAAGDPIRFQGTIGSYTATPNFILTLTDVKIDDDVLKSATEREKAKEQAKRPPRGH